jgi:hypothetical protein
MKIRDVHPDMDRYLREDCYSPYEVYDTTGFFSDLFYPDYDCLLVKQANDVSIVIAHGFHDKDKKRPQCLFVQYEDGKVLDVTRVDATDNNIDLLKHFADGEPCAGRMLDEFVKGSTAKSLSEMFSLCDAVIID